MNATEPQKLMIVRLVQQMGRDANPKSDHGKAIRKVSIGFQRSHIPDSMTKEEASTLIRQMQEAQEFFGSNADALMAVAQKLESFKSS